MKIQNTQKKIHSNTTPKMMSKVMDSFEAYGSVIFISTELVGFEISEGSDGVNVDSMMIEEPCVGRIVGLEEGIVVGFNEGTGDGERDGKRDGFDEGIGVGLDDGRRDGNDVGCTVGCDDVE